MEKGLFGLMFQKTTVRDRGAWRQPVTGPAAGDRHGGQPQERNRETEPVVGEGFYSQSMSQRHISSNSTTNRGPSKCSNDFEGITFKAPHSCFLHKKKFSFSWIFCFCQPPDCISVLPLHAIRHDPSLLFFQDGGPWPCDGYCVSKVLYTVGALIVIVITIGLVVSGDGQTLEYCPAVSMAFFGWL